jgi:hypothetical protein
LRAWSPLIILIGWNEGVDRRQGGKPVAVSFLQQFMARAINDDRLPRPETVAEFLDRACGHDRSLPAPISSVGTLIWWRCSNRLTRFMALSISLTQDALGGPSRNSGCCEYSAMLRSKPRPVGGQHIVLEGAWEPVPAGRQPSPAREF